MTTPDLTVDETYLTMVRAFPLQRIRDDAGLVASIAVIGDLLDRPNLTAGEQVYLDALGQLVEAYENDLKQVDLVDVFGTKSTVSEVFNGKRRLTVGHVRELSARFGLPADVFIE